MDLPFTPEQFFEVFARYNRAIWPAQLALYGVAAAALAGAWRRGPGSDRVAAAALALLWLWTGLVYHLGFFRSVNPAASLFAAMSVVGGGAFAWHGVAHDRLRFGWPPGPRAWIASALVVYALLVYPMIGVAVGHGYWASATFGAPCPTTIFTFGVLLLVTRPYPFAVLVVPVLWAPIGTVAAIALRVPQDFALLLAATLGMAFAIADRRASAWNHAGRHSMH